MKKDQKVLAEDRSRLVPVAVRAREYRRKDSILRDREAVRIMEICPVEHGLTPELGTALCLRTRLMDEMAQKHLSSRGCLIELGVGLSTRRERLKIEPKRWLGLDLPEEISIRQEYFPRESSERLVAADLQKKGWSKTVRQRIGAGKHLLLAEGVLLFLAPNQVMAALQELADGFPDSNFLFDAVSPLGKGSAPEQARWFPENPMKLKADAWRVLELKNLLELPLECRRRLSKRTRVAMRLFPPLRKSHQAILMGKPGA